jgi:hypothetical protein
MATINELLKKAEELQDARDRKAVLQVQNDAATADKTRTQNELAAVNTLIDTIKAEIKVIAAALV